MSFDTLQPLCYAVTSIFFASSTITILLRIYSRAHLLKSFGWDDWCMTSILFFNCGQQAILYYFLHYGAGLHMAIVIENEQGWLENLTYALFAEEIVYVWMHFIVKMAFLLFYLRFGSKKDFKHLVYAAMALNTAFTIIQWFLYCFQCVPLEAFFHRALHPTVKCLANAILAYVPCAFNITVDIIIVVLPIHPLWTLQATLRKRLQLISIVCLGGVVVLISGLRIIVLQEFQKGTDLTYSLGKLIIISSIEIEVAIMAANAPSLKIFWAKYISKTLPSEISRYGNGYEKGSHHKLAVFQRGPGPTGRGISRGGPGDLEYGNHTSSKFVPGKVARTISEGIDMSRSLPKEMRKQDSREMLWHKSEGIVVTQSVGVSVSPLYREF